MGLPSINISFKEQGITAVERGARGIVALILKDTVNLGFNEFDDITDIKTGFSVANEKQIKNAFKGNVKAPQKVIVYVLPNTATDLNEALNYLDGVDFTYVVAPMGNTTELDALVTWVKTQRDTNGKKIKAVVPKKIADHEGVINFTTDSIIVDGVSHTATEFCSRIAGFLAGTPLTMSATYSVLPEVSEVPKKTKAELNTAINNGELVLFKDGGKVKVARAVTSLTTTNATKGSDYKKIKIVEILDMIHEDIQRVSKDNYIGKYGNKYDHKCLLFTAIQGYFETLEGEDLLEKGLSKCGIDIVAQKTFLKAKGVAVGTMTDQQIKVANTEDKVFLTANVTPLDAIEDIDLGILI